MKCLRDLFKKKKIKNMNNKMAINTYLSTIESKNKLSKQEEQRQNHRYREHFDGCQIGGGCGRMSKEVKRLRSTNSYRIAMWI